MPCLQGLDADGRVIYVGTFSKTLFPALRLGYVIVPAGLWPGRWRGAAALGLPSAGPGSGRARRPDGERRLRAAPAADARASTRRRLAALSEAAARHGGGLFTLRPVTTGLHAIADLHGVDDQAAFREALAHGVEVMPVSGYCFDRRRAPRQGLVLGFGCVRAGAARRRHGAARGGGPGGTARPAAGRGSDRVGSADRLPAGPGLYSAPPC